ncbi:hypothetical protein KY361_03105 [Candidatus Woesearchaeota archaeon]|nr:hypothetical protein [Candidatus Woesearchaeota archaeon]
MVGKAELKAYAKKLSLDIFKIGCDRTNFAILKMAVVKPVSIKEIRKELGGLSTMPANRRVNQLVEVGLLKREYKKTKIKATKLTAIFLKLIRHLEGLIEKEVEIKPIVSFK